MIRALVNGWSIDKPTEEQYALPAKASASALEDDWSINERSDEEYALPVEHYESVHSSIESLHISLCLLVSETHSATLHHVVPAGLCACACLCMRL